MCACTTLESDESGKVVWVSAANESHVVNYANYQYHIEMLNLSLGHKSLDIILNVMHEKWEVLHKYNSLKLLSTDCF